MPSTISFENMKPGEFKTIDPSEMHQDVIFPGKLIAPAYEFWRSVSGPNSLPSKEDIRPENLGPILPFINLVDVIQWGNSYRYRHRLLGAAIQRHFPGPGTGKWLDEVYSPEHLSKTLGAYNSASETGHANICNISVELEIDFTLKYWRIILPYSSDGKTVDLLMLVLDYINFDPEADRGLTISYPVANNVIPTTKTK